VRKTLHAIAAAILLWPALAAAATHVVTIEGMAFQPAELAVQPGDRVVWHNKDVVPHTATAKGAFDSGAIAPGQRWTWTVRGKGPQGYVCIYHPGMKGTVAVQ
jgi:plastocyanin